MYELDYEEMVLLDAEDLAEGGILEAYEELKPKLSEYISSPAEIEEILDENLPSYQVKFQEKVYDIYTPATENESWDRATHVFFKIINLQLTKTEIKFYAINGGNDLGGMFLTPKQFEAAIKSLPNKSDWPYIPE